MPNAYSKMNASVRFWRNVPDQPGMDCWEWRGYFGTQGYGHIGVGGRTVKAHRLSFLLCCGEIPKGMEVCHACDNRACVNPSHLWVGTRSDNMQDMLRKGRVSTAKRDRPNCIHGHPFEAQNIYWMPNGARGCKECRRRQTREAARRRAARNGHW